MLPGVFHQRGLHVLTLLLLAGCSLLGGDPTEAIAAAEAKLKAGDLNGATQAYEAARAEFPENVDVAVGAAYMDLLAGRPADADAKLAAVEATAEPERVGDVKLRRALVAMKMGDLEKVKALAVESATPKGALLAGEVALADGDAAAAKPLLEQARGAGGVIAATADGYLSLMANSDQLVAGLAETQALWSLGQRRVAVRSVSDLVKAYQASANDGDEQVLLWAGRAAAVGEGEIALGLLDAIQVPPPGQAWRRDATRAIAACASGDGAGCVAQFDAISALMNAPDGTGAAIPPQGIADARATAALVIARDPVSGAPRDPETAKKLLAGLNGDAVARALAEAGDPASAAAAAVDTLLKSQLGG